MLLTEQFFDTERQVFCALRDKGFAPRTIVDIGASDGSWTRCCLEIFPDAHYRLYEPLYPHLDNYRQGIDRLVARHNVTIRPLGLAEQPGRATFYHTPNQVGSSLLPLSDAKQVEIEIATLDRELGAQPVDIIKMDTQGGELRILKGARAVVPRASIVVAETWLYKGYGAPTPLAHEIIEELRTHDFFVFAAGGPYFAPDHVLYAVDFYFARRDLMDTLL